MCKFPSILHICAYQKLQSTHAKEPGKLPQLPPSRSEAVCPAFGGCVYMTQCPGKLRNLCPAVMSLHTTQTVGRCVLLGKMQLSLQALQLKVRSHPVDLPRASGAASVDVDEEACTHQLPSPSPTSAVLHLAYPDTHVKFGWVCPWAVALLASRTQQLIRGLKWNENAVEERRKNVSLLS